MLNYKHLYYFREVATLGSITRACESLNLTPQTISGQLQLLEEALGVKLFRKQGRNLELTEAGHVARRYADEIFQLGSTLEQAVRNHPSTQAPLFRVGVVDVVPKTIAYKLLEPAMQLSPQIHIVCTEGPLPDLLSELAMHRIELVIADKPMPNTMAIKGFSHQLGFSGISFFAHTSIKVRLQGQFPACLDNAPLLIPSEGTSVRNELENWFHQQQLRTNIVGEFDDSALMRAFGFAGTGVFVAPSVQEDTFTKEPDIHCLGQATGVLEQFFAISVERRISHPAVLAITKHAQDWLHTKAML
ncbi:MAG: transcriptional activator NhaR [Pseudomonadota bacterium]|jgi:LysR family transcriptional activator of nhaA|uniref:Transcriptional activator NhaR n=1 Tax=Thiothrix fructosivorans TaxID=111770 RepID=A0A8B0SFA7_9GAMM|nr:transcriptional activator NhaR [Thiothrix fructosivorans]MBO0615066.1 transcriptional activator NhaR [Thiothrix fructosivorans]QTX09861.1 transcriptional activator NhaR [Thiothrix fructosivorans]